MKTSASSFHLFDDSKLDVELTLNESDLVIRFILTGASAISLDSLIHWGVTLTDQSQHVWTSPERGIPALKHFQWNDQTKNVAGAAQTTFKTGVLPGHKEAEFIFHNITSSTPASNIPRSIEFVLHFLPDRWVKNGKSNFVVPIYSFLQSVFAEGQLQDAAASVVSTRLKRAPQSLTKSYVTFDFRHHSVFILHTRWIISFLYLNYYYRHLIV